MSKPSGVAQMQSLSPAHIPNNQSESNNQEVGSHTMAEVSQLLTIQEDDIYDDVIPGNQPERGIHLNYSNNRSEVMDEDIYDDVIPPSMASVGVLRPRVNGDDQTQANSNANVSVCGQAKAKKNRPTNLDMPSQYLETKDTSVKVAAIIEKLTHPPATNYETALTFTSDNKALPSQLKHRSSPIISHDGNGTDSTIYEVEDPNWGGGYQGHNGGRDSDEDTSWRENEIYEGRVVHVCR